MANFGKFGNLSRNGWNESTQTQTITVGQSAHIGLWGGDGGGNDLEVKAADTTICVTHEEPLPSQPHWRHFLVTGLRVGTTQINAFVASAGGSYSAPVTINVVGKAAKRMVFFPGERKVGEVTEGTIYVIGDKGEHITAAGGPPGGAPDSGNQGGHTVDPTPAGKYVLGPKHHVTTASWPNSVIAWGAAIRLNKDGEAEYEYAPGKWRVATGPNGAVTKASFEFVVRSKKKPVMANIVVQVRRRFIDPVTGALKMTTWEKNDFGRWGWNLRSHGQPTAYYIHTTPEDEHATAEGKEVFLANSHGCVHLKPKERDMLIDAGVLKEGVEFEVRRYDEKGPP